MNEFINWKLPIQEVGISIRCGDLSGLDADVLVTSADVFLSMSGGVAGAVARVAGNTNAPSPHPFYVSPNGRVCDIL